MKDCHIDTKTTDQECQQFLAKAFHSPVVESCAEGDKNSSEVEVCEGNPVRSCCQMRFGGLCRSDPQRELASKLVRAFNSALIENKVKVGSLLLLTTNAESFLGFLGVCMARPTLHTVIEATVDTATDEITFYDPDPAKEAFSPKIMTTHQLFSQIATDPQEHLAVEVWHYVLTWDWDRHRLCIKMSAKLKEFRVDPMAKHQVRKRHAKLRLRLPVPGPNVKRTAQKASGPRPKRHKSKAATKEEPADPARGRAPEDNDNAAGRSVSAEGDQRGPASTSSPSRSGSSMPPEEVPERAAEKAQDLYEASLLPGTVKREEAKALQLIEEHEPFVDAAAAIVAAGENPEASSSSSSRPDASSAGVNPKAKAKAVAKASTAAAVAQGRGSTYFSLEVGLSEVGLAASARSSCYYCGSRIAKGSVRFCWYHNPKKPSSWVHDGCLKHLVQRDGCQDQVKCRLEDFKRQARASQPASVSSAVDAAYAALFPEDS